MRLHWFSPLPPAKTDIGHFTARILPALAARAEVVLWTEQDTWEPALEAYAPVRRYEPADMPWNALNQGDVAVYNIGNNGEFHFKIWQVSRRHPGIVVLHDVRVHEFFAYVYRRMWGDRAGFAGQMERYYGEHGRSSAELWWDNQRTTPYMVEHFPLTPLALENALGAIVHTQQATGIVRQQCPVPLLQSPLPYPAASRTSLGSRDTATRRPDRTPYRLILFGYIHLNRRLEPFLQALADLPERKQFCLDIYGELWDPAYVQHRIDALGMSRIVSVHGFVPEAELGAALDAADLAVNLRFPSMGEASGSQLRIWDHALPSLVTRTGMYLDLPEDVVAFVRPEHEIEDIQAHLRAFLSNPARFVRMGQSGRRLLEGRHAPDAYAHAVVSFAMDVRRLRSRAVACALADRVGSEMAMWAGPHASGEELRKVASEILALVGTQSTSVEQPEASSNEHASSDGRIGAGASLGPVAVAQGRSA